VLTLTSACRGSSSRSRDDARAYLLDSAYRRAALRASLTNPNNAYARLRLDHYSTGHANDWDRLPEWNPAIDPIAAAELDRPSGASPSARSPAATPLSLPEPTSPAASDEVALAALGRVAFSRYPAQLASYLKVALTSRAAAARYGLWVDDQRGVGGIVRARMANGSTELALTCASCHAARTRGQGGTEAITDGANNAALDLGAAIRDGSPRVESADLMRNLASWGPGRLDVTTQTGGEPARIPDLRPVRYLTHLHQDATLALRDRTTLAIRIETLIVTSHAQVLRPPRIIALALAQYLLTLADALPPLEAAENASPRGARIFDSTCASCHAPPELSGPPVALDVVGTDPVLGRSSERGTGMYRVPSLRGAGHRTPLLHDGTVATLDGLFDPTRPTAAFTGRLHGLGPVPGHRFGLALDESDRRALLAFLRAL
jgi:mono/diheme cytochrome c family protein